MHFNFQAAGAGGQPEGEGDENYHYWPCPCLFTSRQGDYRAERERPTETEIAFLRSVIKDIQTIYIKYHFWQPEMRPNPPHLITPIPDDDTPR